MIGIHYYKSNKNYKLIYYSSTPDYIKPKIDISAN